VADARTWPDPVSERTRQAGARIAGLKATSSVCPYCAVGCGQVVYTRDGELVDIEGDPRSPINQGTLCPKGAASRQLVDQPGRLTKVLYRRPGGTDWEELELDRAMDMIAERLIRTREATFEERDERGWKVDRTLGFAHLGGATLDNEENYLIKKLFTAMGAPEGHPTRTALGRVETGATAAELVLSAVNERRLGPLADALQQGTAGRLFRAGKWTARAGLVLHLLRPRLGPRSHYVASGLYLGAGLAFRYAWVAAGRTSASDDRAVAETARRPAAR
jgi:formate dehydrogenase major subunit